MGYNFLMEVKILVQLLSHVQLLATPWTEAHQASLSIWSLLKITSIELLLPSNLLIFCHPLLLPSIFPSIKVFSNESVLRIRWSKYWCFSFNISPSNEYSGMISLQPVSPIRKLAQASYPQPSEGTQNENHNPRKLTKLITWTTTLPISMKL